MELRSNITSLHTTEPGLERIKKNLGLNGIDVIAYCREKIMDERCLIHKKGKNWYCEIDGVIITVNSYSFTVITAHRIKQKESEL